MIPFALSARWYDALYADKDYCGEAAFVRAVLARHGLPAGGSLLDLGTGTCRHAVEFAACGHPVTGIERSPDMLAAGAERAAAAGITVVTADIVTLDLGRSFAGVVSLFHVMCYLAGPGELERGLQAAARHLAPGGLLFFDFWHAAAVLADPPTVRERRVRGDGFTLTRRSVPEHLPALRAVDVHLSYTAEGSAAGSVQEVHRLRYLAVEELAPLLSAAGLRLLEYGPWLGRGTLDQSCWYGYCVAGIR